MTRSKNIIRKIDINGNLLEWNESLRRFELSYHAWGWSDITQGYVRESKRNYKNSHK